MQRIHLVLGLAFVTACAANDAVETVFDPCGPLTIAVSSAHAEDATAVEAAIATWARIIPATQITVVHGVSTDDNVVTIRFVPGQHAIRGAYWDSVGVIEISRDMLAPETHPIAVAHELGHAFGLLHVDGATRTSVMNVGNTTVEPTVEDGHQVTARWAACREGAP